MVTGTSVGVVVGVVLGIADASNFFARNVRPTPTPPHIPMCVLSTHYVLCIVLSSRQNERKGIGPRET